MQLRYRNAARIELESFVNHYKEGFRVLYTGTGLWNENLIIAGYERTAIEMYDAIDMAIRVRLDGRAVIGRRKESGGWFEVAASAGTRQIFVLYSEDKATNTRWVESVSIGRKPIIF